MGLDVEKKRAREQKYYRIHRERRLSQRKAARQRLKLDVLSHYSIGTVRCARCGEADPIVLCIDHINGGGTHHRKTLDSKGRELGNRFYEWLKKNNYPEGYQVLCGNCNMRKAFLEDRRKQ